MLRFCMKSSHATDDYLDHIPAAKVQELHNVLATFAATTLSELFACCVAALADKRKQGMCMEVPLSFLMLAGGNETGLKLSIQLLTKHERVHKEVDLWLCLSPRGLSASALQKFLPHGYNATVSAFRKNFPKKDVNIPFMVFCPLQIDVVCVDHARRAVGALTECQIRAAALY